MKRRTGAFICAALCALTLGATAASSAVAGSTGYLCVPGGTGGLGTRFSEANCLTPAVGGAWGHGVLALNNSIRMDWSKVTKGKTVFKGKVGIPTVTLTVEGPVECIECMVENHEETVGLEKIKELRSTAPFGHVRYKEVKISTPSCEVVGEEINTEPLKFKSLDEGGTLKLEAAPGSGETWTKVKLKGNGAEACALGAELTISGTAKGTMGGPTATFATGTGELRIGTQKLELVGKAAITGVVSGEGEDGLVLTEA